METINPIMRPRYRKCGQTQPIHIYVPEAFNVDLHIDKFPLSEGITRDKIHYFLNLILRLPTLNYDYIDGDGFVTLNARAMQRNFKNYKKILSYMTETGLITCRPWYKKGLQSKGYRLTPEYKSVGIKRVALTEPAVRRIIWDERAPNENDRYPFFTRSLNGAQINEQSLRRYIDWDYERKKIAPSLIEEKKKKVIQPDGSVIWKYTPVDIDQQRQSGLMLLEEILDCQQNGLGMRAIVDDAGGRFHHPISRMKKQHRHMVTWNGKKIVGYDIGCSQFFLLTRLFEVEFWTDSTLEGRISLKDLPIKFQEAFENTPTIGNKKKAKNSASKNLLETIIFVLQKLASVSEEDINRWDNKEIDNKKWLHNIQEYSSLSMLSNCIDEGIDGAFLFQLKSEIRKFSQLAENGNLYEGYQELVRKTLGDSITREQAKDSLCQTMFSSNSFYFQKGSELKQQFSHVFPAMMEVIKLIKTGKKSDDPHARLPLILQALEAEILLNRVGSRVEKDSPGMPLIPLHDGLFTIEAFEFVIKHVMQDELFKATGRHPTLRREEWSKEALIKSLGKHRAKSKINTTQSSEHNRELETSTADNAITPYKGLPKWSQLPLFPFTQK